MKLVRKVRLVFREGKSDKVYEVDLVELPGAAAERFLVNFRYGRRGSALRDGTKTTHAVTLAEAEDVYRSVVVSKTNSGYWDESGAAPVRATAAPASATSENPAARTAALLDALAGEESSQERGRLAWRLGQGDAIANTALLTTHIGRGAWFEDYSIAFTLGRWRDPATIPALDKLRRHANVHVREMALEALLVTQSAAAVASETQTERVRLPAALRTALEARNESDILRALDGLATQKSNELNDALVASYRLALVEPAMQRALLAFCRGCALAPGTFRGLRHLFKTAEMRVDYDMFACLAYRFDTTKPYFRNNWDRAYVPGVGSMSVSKELAKDNARLAYSDKTRTYLRKRAWRTLRRLGRADSPHYVALATAALLTVSDDDAVEPRKRETHLWNRDERRPLIRVREFDAFAPLVLFNHILNGAHPGYKLAPTGSAWYRTGDDSVRRGERFPHLWDRAPAAALDLLKRSRCGPVHDAAIRMLVDKQEFLDALSGAEIAQLLASPYPQTARFALPLAESRFTRGAGDEGLLLALLRSTLPEARELGVRFLGQQQGWAANPALLIELLLIFGDPVPRIVDQALAAGSLAESDQPQVLTGVITQLLARNLEISAPAAETLAKILMTRLGTAVSSVPVTLLDRLLSESAVGRQILGARLLVASSLKFTEIPGRLLQHIHGSAHEDVRAIAIALLTKQSPDDLVVQAPNLAELLYRGSPAERRELLALFESLCARGAEAEARVLRALSPLLFRGDQDSGQGDEVAAFILARRDAAARVFDKDTVWRLLQAQATAAQRVGAALLAMRAATDFSVRQWARLAAHSDLSARQYAMRAFEANEGIIKQNARDALRLLDTNWDDAREFGFRYFRERYADGDWAPEYIVGVCDSTRPDVQDFGREILQRFFQQSQGPHYLATLSEHPSINVQLFVTNFLEHHAGGQRDRILALRDFFVSVLSKVNKARTAKDRVLEFLLRESLKDDAVATMVAEIFTRVSLTIVRRDRSDLIKAMIAMQAAFPQLSVPIKALPVRSAGGV
jgi:hypothetical protein